MTDGLAIGRLFGIEIRVSIAWAVLIAIVMLIGADQAILVAPELSAVAQWGIGAAVAAAFLVSVLAHELAHALVARRHGVDATSIVLGFVGGLAPLSIEARRPRDELEIALAGPLLSLALALVVVLLAIAVGAAGGSLGAVAGGLVIIGGLNLIIGALSLVPGLPLDGGRIVRALAWARSGDADRATKTTARIGRLAGFTTIGVGIAVALMDHTTEGLLVMALGWFLATGARTLDRRLGLELLVRGLRVADATDREAQWVPPGLSVDTFANRYEGEQGVPALAIVDDGKVVGVLGPRRLRRLGRRKFAATRAADVMATPPAAPILSPDTELWTAMNDLNQAGIDALAVADDEGTLLGLMTRARLGEVIGKRMLEAEAARGSAGR